MTTLKVDTHGHKTTRKHGDARATPREVTSEEGDSDDKTMRKSKVEEKACRKAVDQTHAAQDSTTQRPTTRAQDFIEKFLKRFDWLRLRADNVTQAHSKRRQLSLNTQQCDWIDVVGNFLRRFPTLPAAAHRLQS